MNANKVRRKTALVAPFPGSALLRPITSCAEIRRAAKLFELPCGSEYLDELFVGCLYFYDWCKNPKAVLLVTFTGSEIVSLEARNGVGRQVSARESAPILQEAHRLLRSKGGRLVNFIQYGFGVIGENEATRH